MTPVYPYDLVVFIGRFQPVHLAHSSVIQKALINALNLLILAGSSNQPRTIKNPWTFSERSEMIYATLFSGQRRRVAITALKDQAYNDQRWVGTVQQHVQNEIERLKLVNPRVGLIGHSKDDSSYYLKMFPQWNLIDHDINEQINATDIRSILFEGKSIRYINGVVPDAVMSEHIVSFLETPEFQLLKKEYDTIKSYKKAWAAAPYAPIFVTVDACVVQSGHVLLVERKATPGQGLLALPGGFLNPSEWIIDGMIRELREETKLKVPAPVLKGSIKTQRYFDKPDRSLRGRTITHAFLIELPPGPLPLVKGSDDAARACWIPVSEIDESKMFEDHYAMIQLLLGRV
jgi:bifunctional NMN adenylyltransferase/nudix hydrolase